MAVNSAQNIKMRCEWSFFRYNRSFRPQERHLFIALRTSYWEIHVSRLFLKYLGDKLDISNWELKWADLEPFQEAKYKYLSNEHCMKNACLIEKDARALVNGVSFELNQAIVRSCCELVGFGFDTFEKMPTRGYSNLLDFDIEDVAWLQYDHEQWFYQ